MTNKKETGYFLRRCTNLWLRNLYAAVSPMGLSNTQFIILSGLEKLLADGELVTQKKLAEARGINVNVVSQLARSLEKKGYLIRRNSEIDTRAKNLELTKSGRNVLQKARPLVQETGKRFFAPIKNRKHLCDMLKSLITENDQL